MATAATAEFLKLKPVRRVLFILRRYVVALLTLGALQNYVISRHKSSKSYRVSIGLQDLQATNCEVNIIPPLPKRYRHRLCGRLRG